VTSSVSGCRSGTPGPVLPSPDLLSCPAGPPAEPSRFPCIYPRYPGCTRATVGLALGPFRTLVRADGRAESAGGRRSFWTISSSSRPGRTESQTGWRCALSATRMLAADGCASRWDNPACHVFCAVWVRRRGGGVAVAMIRGGQHRCPDCAVHHPNLPMSVRHVASAEDAVSLPI
jgi:hypothetical protein